MKTKIKISSSVLSLVLISLISLTFQSCKSPSGSIFSAPDTIDCAPNCPTDKVDPTVLPTLSLNGSNPATQYVGSAISPVTFNNTDMTECVLVSGVVPAGLSINNTTCAITGTPSAAGTTTLVLKARNIIGDSGNVSVTLTYILPPPTITLPSSTLNAQVNTAISTFTVSANQTLTSCAFSGSTIAGLVYNTAACTITGTPTSTANITLSITGTNANGTSSARTLNIVVLPEAPVITASSTSIVVKKGVSIGTLSFTTTETISSCTMSPTVAGLSINSSTCAITGNPTTQTASAGSNFNVTATGAGGTSNTVTINLKVYQSYCDGLGATGSATPVRGNGTSGNPFILCGRQGLSSYLFANSDQNYYYKMGDDVNMGGVIFQTDRTKPFAGHFDGGGHVISGITTNDTLGDGVGFFSVLANGAEVKRIVFNNNSFNGNSKTGTIAGIVSTGATVSISDIVIINSSVSTVAASIYAGAGIGYANTGATINVSNVLMYNVTTDNSGATKVFTGSSATYTKNYSNVLYDIDMETTNGLVAETQTTSHTMADLRDSATYAGFSTNWDLTPTSSSNPATLKKNADQVYSDGVTIVN